jgi:chromosomal replication initiator protein
MILALEIKLSSNLDQFNILENIKKITSVEIIKTRVYEEGITIEKIIKEVCKYYNIERIKLEIGSKKEIILKRQLTHRLCRELTQDSFEKIGKEVGGKKPETVLYSCRIMDKIINFKGLRKVNSEIKKDYEELKSIIKNNK